VASGSVFSSDRQHAAVCVWSLLQRAIHCMTHWILFTEAHTTFCVCSTCRLIHVHCRAHNSQASLVDLSVATLCSIAYRSADHWHTRRK
jgi:hypothetical protein